MKIKEIRFTTPDKLRALCVEQGWYTCGSNADYEALLNSTIDFRHNRMQHLTTQRLQKMAENIIAHSDPESIGCTGDLSYVMFLLAKICETHFVTLVI